MCDLARGAGGREEVRGGRTGVGGAEGGALQPCSGLQGGTAVDGNPEQERADATWFIWL